MPTFGDTTAGASSFPCTGDRALVSKFTLPVAGNVTQLNCRFDPTSAAGTSFKALIYADSAGAVGALLAQSAPVSVPAGGGDIAAALSVSLAAGDYWLGYVCNDFNARAQTDAGGTGLKRRESHSYATPADPWGTDSGTGTDTLNVYATYSTGPSITAQPADDREPVGGTANFSVTATGTGTLSYQWKLNGTNVGANSSTYTRTGLVIGDTGTVTVDITDDNGTTTSANASLTVYPTGALERRHPWAQQRGNVFTEPSYETLDTVLQGIDWRNAAALIDADLWPAGGAISGTIAASFTTAGTLTGTGALSGTIPATFTVTGTLSTGGSIGALSGTVAANFATSAALTGTGALSGTIAPTFAVSATLTGTGALTGTIAPAFATSATLTGTGSLANTIAAAFATSGSLTGTGALAGTIAPAFTVTGTLSSLGGGALSGTIPAAFTASATLTGTGALTGTVPATFATTASLTGTGTLGGTVASSFAASGTLTSAGSGALSSTVSSSFGVSGTLTGTGALASIVPAAFTVSGTLQGLRQVSGTIASSFAVTGALTGTGALSTTVAATFTTTGTLTGRGALAGLAAMTFGVSAILTDGSVPNVASPARSLGVRGGSRSLRVPAGNLN